MESAKRRLGIVTISVDYIVRILVGLTGFLILEKYNDYEETQKRTQETLYLLEQRIAVLEYQHKFFPERK